MTLIARLLNLLNPGDAQRFPGGWNAALEPLLQQLCSALIYGDAESQTTGPLWLYIFSLSAVLGKSVWMSSALTRAF